MSNPIETIVWFLLRFCFRFKKGHEVLGGPQKRFTQGNCAMGLSQRGDLVEAFKITKRFKGGKCLRWREIHIFTVLGKGPWQEGHSLHPPLQEVVVRMDSMIAWLTHVQKQPTKDIWRKIFEHTMIG